MEQDNVMGKSIYSDFILKNVPRVITQVDRDEHSTTYGSCDRNHWHLKTRDFTSSILQQTGLSLALLYSVNFDGNIYYKNENLKKWSEATVYYWSKIQLKDGSFNEYYPYEHGFPPTAFSLYGACETYKRLEMMDETLIDKFRKTGKYLISHIEERAFNQEIASITALYSLFTIIKEDWVLAGIEPKLNRVLKLQSSEGWFPEYGGADLGYLSVALDMLSEYYYMSGDTRVKTPIQCVINFITYFVHPDGTIGGEYGSRNTTYFLPNGIENAVQFGDVNAAAIKDRLFNNSKMYNYFMDSVDDRYFSHYLMHSFLKAIEKERDNTNVNTVEKLPFLYNHCEYFKESGLISATKLPSHVIISLRKGGVIKVWRDGEEILIDCGYRVNYGKGKVAATNWLDPSYQISFGNHVAKVRGSMNVVSLKVSTPIMHMGLRLVAFLLGNKIISFLKKKMIFANKHSDIKFERIIDFRDTEIIIKDTIESNHKIRLEKASNMSLRHVASGKFYSDSDLLSETGVIATGINEAKINIIVSLDDGKVTYQYEQLA